MRQGGSDIEAREQQIPFRLGWEPEPGYFLMLLVESGLARVECEAARFNLVAGSLILAPPGSRPRIMEGSSAKSCAFSFARSLVDAFAFESSIDFVVETLASTIPRLTRLRGKDFDEARNLFSFLRSEAIEERPAYLSMLRLKLMELLLLFDRGEVGKEVQALKPAVRFRPEDLERYIQERYADQLSLDELATRFQLNPAYLSRAFSRERGSTIVEYVNKIRIQKACALLKRSRSSILDIAIAVGYNNLSHFNRYFRRLVGMSPREYRDFAQR